jgi:ribonucleoside-diphosphate reductase alpha chain
MTLSQLQDYTFNTKYARWNPALGRRETYVEAVDRVFSMHERVYAGYPVQDEVAYAKQAARERLVLGSQRALQFGGKPVEDKNARLYNCTVSYCDRTRFFQEALWLLLCGCGVGFSVQHHHVAKLPQIARPTGEKVTFVVPDDIEGWSDALGALMSSYFVADQPIPEYAGKQVVFDYSKVRPLGSPLSSGIGKAPGPAPLKRSLERIRVLLENRLVTSGTPCVLPAIDAYDIVMHASDAVLAGGVRRSATICIFSVDDEAMIAAKTGDWFIKNPQRGRSNNSALLLRDKTSYEQFQGLMKAVKEFGEPGFVWADSTEIMYNPCVEIGMYPVDEVTGETGWAFCNLCEINVKACTTPEIFARACTAAAILGTLQAGYASFAYLGAVTERIVRREALLGCSMTGMMDNPAIAFDPKIQRDMAQLILDVNARVAKKLGINPCARATCVKPAGTTSCILGTASGIHAHHARRYFRRVQANLTEAPYQYFKAHNLRAVERSVWNPNGTDAVITFCIEVPESARTLNDVGAVELLKFVKLTQENWVNHGKRADRCTAPWLRHNVSNTITVRDNEWDDVAHFIYDNRDAFAGVSLLPMGGDLDYPQAPFCAVLTFDEIVKEYGTGSLFASGLIVDGMHAFADDLWAACACALGTGHSLELPSFAAGSDQNLEDLQERIRKLLMQKDWVRRAHKFAKNYFGGDVRRMTYCLKRVHNCKMWEDLQREYIPVDYTMMLEQSDDTKLVDAVACAGGKCDIV